MKYALKLALLLGVALFFNPMSLYAASVAQSVAQTVAQTVAQPGVDDPEPTNILSEIMEMATVPAGCRLADTNDVEEIIIGTARFHGTYRIWQDCDDTSGYLGTLLVKPLESDGMLVYLQAELDYEGNFTPFQIALTKHFQQSVTWRYEAASDSDNAVLAQPTPAPEVSELPGLESTPTPTYVDLPTATTASIPTLAPTSLSQSSSSPSSAQTPPQQAGDQSARLSLPASPVAIVRADALNLRGGPDTSFFRIGSVKRGEMLTITGQVNNCTWLQVRTQTLPKAWISGWQDFVEIQGGCNDIPLVLQPEPTATPQRPQQTGSTPSRNRPVGTDPNKGCYLITNFLNADLTFTMTRVGSVWNHTFKVLAKGTRTECLDPGDYTYTIDAPPPWHSINGKLESIKGDTVDWSVGGE